MSKIYISCLFISLITNITAQEIIVTPVNGIIQRLQSPLPADARLLQETGKQLPDSLISACVADINQDSIASSIQSLENSGTRYLLAGNRREVAEWIRQKYVSMGYTNAVLDSFIYVYMIPGPPVHYDSCWQYNVLATLEGQINPGVNVIIGSHYDDALLGSGDPLVFCPGADDNASSTAAILEIARVFKLHNVTPASGIVFAAWAAEEMGRFGSNDKALKLKTEGSCVKAYINLDMLAYNPGLTNWDFIINNYDGAEWLTNISASVTITHTTLSAVITGGNSMASDSYSFWAYGFDPVYFREFNTNPNYHSASDLLANCNMPYCTEITKVAAGTLLAVDQIPLKVKYDLFNPGTGNSLIPRWKAGPETNISGYKVRIGYSEGSYHKTIITADTSVTLSGLSQDTVYYVAVSALNTLGYEGPATEYNDRPQLAPMDQGILIVDDSDGGILNPADTKVDSFYNALVQNYQHNEYDAYMQQQIHLSDLGKYSSVLWHINFPSLYSVLYRYQKEVRSYLKLGGKILFTLAQPGKVINSNPAYPNHFFEGSFMYDYLGIRENELNNSSRFNAGLPAIQALPEITADPAKTYDYLDHHLINIEALWPADSLNILYRYGTSFDTASPQGSMHGDPVGLKSEDAAAGWKTVILSFPLYYMDFYTSKAFTEWVMTDYFGEMPIGIIDQKKDVPTLDIIPNPVYDHAMITFTLTQPAHVAINFYNTLGERVKSIANQYYSVGAHSIPLEVTNFPMGIYFLKLQLSSGLQTKKVIISR